jgi:hypothetical protein
MQNSTVLTLWYQQGVVVGLKDCECQPVTYQGLVKAEIGELGILMLEQPRNVRHMGGVITPPWQYGYSLDER